MNLRNLNKSVSIVQIAIDLVASINGALTITGGTITKAFSLPDVTSTEYQNVFAVSYKLEDVGSIEVLSIFFLGVFQYNGNGSLRWQISGDGGNTFVTIGEGSFNVGVLTADAMSGVGLWITSISPGDNKLKIRMQAKAAAGTVQTTIRNDTAMILVYRKKVLF